MKGLRQRINGRKINIVTLGCAKNLVDSEQMAGQLQANDYTVNHEDTDHDAGIVIINTCGFIDHAKDHSMQTIEAWLHEKERGMVEKVFVTGCLSERYHDELTEQLPEVDGIYGLNEIPRLVAQLGGEFKNELVGERQLSTPSHFAYLKISEGCDRTCRFCIIPKIRGKHVSKPIEELVAEAQHIIAGGTKELILIAQDLTFYGRDLYGKRRLDDLLKSLSDIDGLEWLRLHYTHPASFPTEILKTMAERSNICNYLDIPLQHITDNMLKIMRRSINRQKTIDLINHIRAEVPNIAFRSTFLTGHPGETEDDHAQAVAFLKEYRLDRVGVFIYSPEEDTPSYDMVDEVPDDVKQRRFDELMQTQQAISLELNRARIGNTYKTIIDRRTRSGYVGRTEFDSPDVDNEVIIRAKNLRVGNFYDVNITNAREYDLIGRV